MDWANGRLWFEVDISSIGFHSTTVSAGRMNGSSQFLYPGEDGKARTSRLRMMLGWGVLLLSLSWPSTIKSQNSTLAGPVCPFNFSVLDQYPYVAATVKDTVDQAFQCSTLRGGLEIVVSLYLRETGYFLPPQGTSAACTEAYEAQLIKQGVSRSFNVTRVCQFSYINLERGADLCKGVQTAAEFRELVPDPELLKDLNLSCSQSLESTTVCGVCNAAMVKTTGRIQQVVRVNNTSTSCTNFTTIYTAGIVNEPGPLDPGTALCMFYIKAAGGGSSVNYVVYAVVGVGAVLLLGGVVGFCFYRRRKKIKEAQGKARMQRTSDFLDSTRVPHSSVNWFTIEEIKRATGNFSRDSLLGSGGYGNVYKGTLRDGSIIAVKRFKNCSPVGDASFVHEVEMISSVRHKHLVAIRGCCVDSGGTVDGHQRIILYDYMPNGSLQDHLYPKKRGYCLDWPTRVRIALGMAKGLAYLHHDALPAIIHRDIKASNILLDSDFNARLADFGLAKFTPEGVSHVTTKVAGTFGYVAPEYALYGQLTEKSDVYSFGMVLLELITGRKALSSATDDPPQTLLSDWAWPLVRDGLWRAVVDAKLDYTREEEVERFLLVALLCSHPQPYHRPTIGQALKMLEGHLAVPVVPDRPAPLSSRRMATEGGSSSNDGVNNRTGFSRSSYTGSSSSRSTYSSRDPLTKSATDTPPFTSSSELKEESRQRGERGLDVTGSL